MEVNVGDVSAQFRVESSSAGLIDAGVAPRQPIVSRLEGKAKVVCYFADIYAAS